MTVRGPQAAALALHRFGLGPLRNSIAAIASDPRGALLEELDRPVVGGALLGFDQGPNFFPRRFAATGEGGQFFFVLPSGPG